MTRAETFGMLFLGKTFLRHLFIELIEKVNCTLKAIENTAF